MHDKLQLTVYMHACYILCNGDRCEQEVDLFLNGFCASATPQTETVTDTQTITNTQRVISISTARETETVTRISTAIQRETVVSTTTTTDTSTSITTTTEQNLITITNVRSTTVYFTIATTTTETVTIQSCSPQVNIDSHDTTITTTVCPSSTQHDDPETELKLSTLGDAFNSAVNSEISTKSKASITALGSLTGISIVVLSAVIIGWVWTCWIIKKKRGISHTTTSKNVK